MPGRPGLALLARLAWLLALLAAGCLPQPAPSAEPPRDCCFCFWNVENFFDDRDDQRPPPDAEFDAWFARDPDALRLKLDRLAAAILRLNDGKGPDVLALVEVESPRAADLLRERLNLKLDDSRLHYSAVLMKELDAGRHVAPAILTRLPAGRKLLLHGHRQRILEAHVELGGQDLVIICSHWTSRVTDESGNRRAKYGSQIHGLFRAMFLSNPDVNMIVCGDFNDEPGDPSVAGSLRAAGDRDAVLASGRDSPLLFNLMAGKDPERFGTLWHQDRWYVFDQICVSPALLRGDGPRVDVDSVQTIRDLVRPGDRRRRPWRFGGPSDQGDRGWSDHFPVVVRFKTQ